MEGNAAAFVANLALIWVVSALFKMLANALCRVSDKALLASEVLLTLPRPTIDLSIPVTVPVKLGLLIGDLVSMRLEKEVESKRILDPGFADCDRLAAQPVVSMLKKVIK